MRAVQAARGRWSRCARAHSKTDAARFLGLDMGNFSKKEVELFVIEDEKETLDILENLQKDLSHPAFKPSKLLREKVNCGNLGRKTGQGFFSYE